MPRHYIYYVVGDYNGESGVLYCMTIRDIELQGAFFDDNDEQATRYDITRNSYIEPTQFVVVT